MKLLVAGAGPVERPGEVRLVRQAEPIDFFPTYYTALAPRTEPAAPTTGSAADPWGALTAPEQAALIDEAKEAKRAEGASTTLGEIASVALTSGSSKNDDAES